MKSNNSLIFEKGLESSHKNFIPKLDIDPVNLEIPGELVQIVLFPKFLDTQYIEPASSKSMSYAPSLTWRHISSPS